MAKNYRGGVGFWFVVITLLHGCFSTACGVGAVEPTPIATPHSPPTHNEFFFNGATNAEKAYFLAQWSETASCVGISQDLPNSVGVTLVDGPVPCGGGDTIISAAGCWAQNGNPYHIALGRKWFGPSLNGTKFGARHELVHLALWWKGDTNNSCGGKTRNPIFDRCDPR